MNYDIQALRSLANELEILSKRTLEFSTSLAYGVNVEDKILALQAQLEYLAEYGVANCERHIQQ